MATPAARLGGAGSRQAEDIPSTPDIDPQDGGRELPSADQTAVATVLTKLQKWGDYPAWGEVLQPTMFIPMKTPLSEEIMSNWSTPEGPKHRLTVSDLLEAQERAGRQVGMILDLSNHDCLYTSDIPQGLHYEHIKLVAKELPPREFVHEVCTAAAAFWKANPHLYIAIHCAYGFNRTGFVLCCYLIEQLGFTVDQALDAFRTARPPGVKHAEFRAELRARYESTNATADAIHPVVPSPRQDLNNTVTDLHTPLPKKLAADALARWHSQGLDQDVQEQAEVPSGVGQLARLGSDAQGSGFLDQTPEGQVQCRATPMSENDSLGANDRFILQGLRAQQPSSMGRQLAPSQLEGLLTDADKSPASTGTYGRPPIHPGLHRKSIGEIDWSLDVSANPQSAANPAMAEHKQSLVRKEEVAACTSPSHATKQLQALKL